MRRIPESGAKLGPAARHREAWEAAPPAESPGGETKAAACLARLPVNSNNDLWAPGQWPAGSYVGHPDSVIVPSTAKYVHPVPLVLSHLVTECVMPSHPTGPSQDERNRAGNLLFLCLSAGMGTSSRPSTTHHTYMSLGPSPSDDWLLARGETIPFLVSPQRLAGQIPTTIAIQAQDGKCHNPIS